MASLFDFLGAINEGKSIQLDADNPYKEYVPFQINNGMSQHLDTVLIANEMNKRPWLSKEMQFKFCNAAAIKKRRFGKWAKVETEANKEDVETVSEYYQVNKTRATEYLKRLTEDHLTHMRKMNNKGGAEIKTKGKK